MNALTVALTEGERVAILGFLGVVLAAAIPATVAAVMTHRTHKVAKAQAAENAEQHGASQALLASLALEVGTHSSKVDAVGDKVDRLADSHDLLAAKFHRHLGEHEQKDREQ